MPRSFNYFSRDPESSYHGPLTNLLFNACDVDEKRNFRFVVLKKFKATGWHACAPVVVLVTVPAHTVRLV